VVFAALGFAWWEAFPALQDRYWAGVASRRPAAYWLWGNLAALLIACGPVLGAAVACAGRDMADAVRRPSAHALGALAAAGVAMVLVADLTLLSKAEVERIWLPFIGWMMLSCAYLPERWRGAGLALQVGFAITVQHLLRTAW
jgi:methylthioxylose transferase